MKQFFLIVVTASFFIACGSGSDKKTETSDTKEETQAEETNLSDNPVYQAGLAIEVKQDCATCHKVDTKVIGPTYKEIAAKYAGVDTAVSYLSKKVISGGQGVWGEIPMAAHPNLSQADAEAIVKYILLLK